MKLTALLFSLVLTLATAGNAAAGVIFDFSELGGNVALTMSGSIDLNATLGSPGFGSNVSQHFSPDSGNILTGDAVTSDFYWTNLPWTPFGSGGSVLFDASAGHRVALFSTGIGVPLGYVSGSPLSATATVLSATFASLGMTPGSYVTVLTNDQLTDTVTVNVGPTVPEPATLLLLGTGLAAAGMRRRMKKRG